MCLAKLVARRNFGDDIGYKIFFLRIATLSYCVEDSKRSTSAKSLGRVLHDTPTLTEALFVRVAGGDDQYGL